MGERKMKRSLNLAASSEVAVLIAGETGTGKSSLARQIHQMSRRGSKSFVTINLASIHEGTSESCLFGHERGAYTGAEQKRVGKFELAQRGTVFLDEVGELSLKLQARLLEVLQSRSITPVGGNREVKLDVRVIAASHRNLDAMVEQGTFREDLLHRLRVLTIELPPLRECAEDFDRTVHSLLSELSILHQKQVHRLDEAVVQIFEGYYWPGNYRELRNVLEAAILSVPDSCITIADLPAWFMRAVAGRPIGPVRGEILKTAEIPMTLNYFDSVARFDKIYLTYALLKYGGRVNLTSRKIGMNKSTLMRRIKQLQIDRARLGAG
jgi:two-component system nitrogen regulation response regulator NtrX